jgi:transcriptional regulator with XRE-family HTH domain
MNITGTILKNLRIKRNITLDQLAAKLNEMFDINITGSMLSKWETGKAAPVYDHLKRLASYYDVTTDFLLGFDQYENLTCINSDNNLDITNNKIRYSKKQNNIKIITELLEDDKITNKDLLFIQDFIHLFISRKDKNLYR